MTQEPLSSHSLLEANRERGRFADAENAAGSAGKASAQRAMDKEPFFVNHGGAGFGKISIGLSWDRLADKSAKGLVSLAKSLLGQKESHVDLDIGCLYELKDGSKGCLQAFGDLFGNYNEKPYIHLSGDERSGKSDGLDESFAINGAHWDKIARILVYAYIYKGVVNWQVIRSHCLLDVLDQHILLDLEESSETLPICALFTLENDNDMMKITRCIEYFAGHPELDRAYGYGLSWEEGSKS